jgi:hypothetical protein
MSETLFADTARFVHETIDNETVLLDSVRGHLFLFTGSGPWLWHRMQRGGTIDEVVHEVSERFGAEAAGPTRQFLDSLSASGMLLTERPAGEPSAVLPYPDAFAPPVLEKYDDIADIIAMDPIHDVDPAQGWPRRMDAEKSEPPR